MVIIFILFNFFISAFSDFILNILSRLRISPEAIRALKPYFDHQPAIVSAIYAGLTVISVLVLTIMISKLVFKFNYPKNIIQLFLFISLAAPLGYFADILIYYFQIFGPTLNEYYKKAGAGFWGSAAFVFSILFSFIFMKFIPDKIRYKK
jgi:hypothetical protein